MYSSSLRENQRLFGEFRCPQCSRQWMSGCSWKNMGQQCQRCGINVLPYTQTALQRANSDKIDTTKPHPSHLCEKCKKLGRSCV